MSETKSPRELGAECARDVLANIDDLRYVTRDDGYIWSDGEEYGREALRELQCPVIGRRTREETAEEIARRVQYAQARLDRIHPNDVAQRERVMGELDPKPQTRTENVYGEPDPNVPVDPDDIDWDEPLGPGEIRRLTYEELEQKQEEWVEEYSEGYSEEYNEGKFRALSALGGGETS